MLSVFGSEANGAGDGLENGPVAFRDSSKGRAPSAVLGAGFKWLDIFEIWHPKKRKRKNMQFNREVSKVRTANAREGPDRKSTRLNSSH